MIRHLLFAADYSTASREAAPLVREIAERTGARLTVLHVLEMPDRRMTDWLAYLEMGGTQELIRERRREFEKPYREMFSNIPGVRFAFRQGDAAAKIVDYARRAKVDLILIPTHGLGVYRRLLIGSVAAKVLHDAACAVWTVTPHATAASGGVMAAVDLGPESGRVAAHAAEFGKALGREVVLAHVANASEEDDWARTKLAEIGKANGIFAAPLVVHGPVAEAIDRLTDSTGASLLVIGRGRIAEPLGRLRTNAYQIIRDAKCPVISV